MSSHCSNDDVDDVPPFSSSIDSRSLPSLPSPQKKTCQAKVSRQPEILPDELIEEILLRVPAKFLLQYRFVCQSWKSLILDPQFVMKHFHRSVCETNLSHHRLAIPTILDLGCHGVITCSLNSLFKKPSTLVDARHQITSEYLVVGSCNGLLCLFDVVRGYVCLYNPCIRWTSENSPCLADNWLVEDSLSCLFGFGYDHITDKYKVVVIFCKTDPNSNVVLQKFIVKVFTLGDKTWRRIHSFPFVPLKSKGSGILVSGSLNWLAFRADDFDRPLVVSLHLGNEKYRKILLPDLDDDGYSSPNIGVSRGWLCFSYKLIKKTQFVMWVMKDYGVKESWNKFVTIPYVDLGVSKFLRPVPLFMSQNGDILVGINNRGEFVLYDPRDNALKKQKIDIPRDITSMLAKVDGPMRSPNPIIYIESLVLPSHG